jgi:DHA2 family multidrug resistance protein
MALFRDRNFVTASVMIFVTSVVNVIPTTVIPLFVQNVQGYDVLYTGILLTPRGVGAVLIMLFLGRVADRTDIRVVILIAMLLQAVSAYAFRFITPDWPGNQLMCWSTVAAIGTSMSTLPLNLIAFSTLSPQMRPMGASLYALVRNVSQGLGAALTISYIARSTEANHVRLLERISIYNPIMTGPGMPDSWSATSPLSLKLMSLEVWRQASVIAYANLFTISAIGVFFFLPLLLIVRAPKRKSAPNPVEEAEILEPSAA